MSVPLPLGTSFSFSGVPAGTYTFAVRAVNTFGSSSASNAVTLSFPGTCTPPATPTDFIASKSGHTVFVSWSPPASGAAPTGYLLNVSGAIDGSFHTTNLAVSGAVPPGAYTLSVLAVNACGKSAGTTPQTIDVP